MSAFFSLRPNRHLAPSRESASDIARIAGQVQHCMWSCANPPPVVSDTCSVHPAGKGSACEGEEEESEEEEEEEEEGEGGLIIFLSSTQSACRLIE